MQQKTLKRLLVICLILAVPWIVVAEPDGSATPPDHATTKDESRKLTGLLAHQAGLMDVNSTEFKELDAAMPLSELDDSVYLRPRQMLNNDYDNFMIFTWDCDYPIMEYYFYANPGWVDVYVSGDYDQDIDVYLRTNGSYPTQGDNVMILDGIGYGIPESGSYYNPFPQLFVLLVGFRSIEDCDYGSQWINSVSVSLEYEPFDWDIRFLDVTTNTPYPDNSAVITARIQNNSPYPLDGDPPWNYSWELGLHMDDDCIGTPEQSRVITQTIPPYSHLSKSFTINGPHSGEMQVACEIDVNDSLPLEYPSQSCSSPVNLLWSVDLSGTCNIYDNVRWLNQPLRDFSFDIVRITGADTAVLDNITTDFNGHFSSEIPSGNYDIYYRLSTDQPQLFPIKTAQSPHNFFYDLYRSGKKADQSAIEATMVIDSTALVENGAISYLAFRMMRDMTMTDSIVSLYSPFDALTLSENVDIFMDQFDTAGSCYKCTTPPTLIVEQQDVLRRTACHELGHHIMHLLQGTPPWSSPFYESAHYLNMISDSVFAFQEGWAQFLHFISMDPSEAYPFDSQYVESNQWWRGPKPQHVGDTMDCGDIIEGSVASMLYDLYDSPSRPTYRVISEDDNIQLDSMMQYIIDCIWNFRSPVGNQTRTFAVLAERLVQDTSARWYEDSSFQDIRQNICEIFAVHHFAVSQDFCLGSAGFSALEGASGLADGSREKPACTSEFTCQPISKSRRIYAAGRTKRTRMDRKLR